MRTPFSWSSDLGLRSDDRKNFSAILAAHLEGSRDGSHLHQIGLTLTARPASNVQLSVGPSFSRGLASTQYVTAFDDPTATATFGRRYVFAHLDQRSFELGTRADWTLGSARMPRNDRTSRGRA